MTTSVTLPVRRLVRMVLEAERRIRAASPGRPPLEKPDGADEVLAVLAAAFEPDIALTHKQMVEAGIPPGVANLVRQWAQRTGCWPYPRAQGGFAARAAAARERKRKGGAS